MKLIYIYPFYYPSHSFQIMLGALLFWFAGLLSSFSMAKIIIFLHLKKRSNNCIVYSVIFSLGSTTLRWVNGINSPTHFKYNHGWHVLSVMTMISPHLCRRWRWTQCDSQAMSCFCQVSGSVRWWIRIPINKEKLKFLLFNFGDHISVFTIQTFFQILRYRSQKK